MKTRLEYALMFLATGLCHAHAEGLGQENVVIGGFGTLGVARTNTDLAQFARYNQAQGVTSGAGIGTDTNLGLQATYKYNDWLSGTAQILTRKNTSPAFTSELTWAFVKMKLSSDFSVRAGRMVLPVFMISDSQNVGYANTMMRPPIEMYGQAPIEHVDGADLSYQHSIGDTTVSAQLGAGVSTGKLFLASGGGSVATFRAPLAALAVSVEHGPFMVRVARLNTRFGSDDVVALNGLVNTLTGAGFGQLARDLTVVGGKRIAFTAVGMTMDWQNFLVQAEYGQRRAQEPVYVPDSNSGYAMFGYRIGRVLPYYAHASLKQAGRSVNVPANFPASGALSNAVNRGLMTLGEQRSDLLGVRWDFSKSMALKVQVDRVKPQKKTGALIFGPAAGLTTPVTVVGATVDFVF